MTDETVVHLVESVMRREEGIELAIPVHDDRGEAVQFRGRYVALRDPHGRPHA